MVVVKHGGNVREVSRVHIARLRGTSNEVNEEVEIESGESDEDWEGVVLQREELRERDDDGEEDGENVVEQIPGERLKW